MSDTNAARGHGGILFPFDMFRPTMLASIIGETFIAKARNVLDARLELTRHPEAQLVMLRMHGSIVGDDAATFWRENADLSLMLSQVFPRQVFLYYVGESPKRQGFIVAQQGQALAGDDVDESMMPPEAAEEEWPVARLAAQLRLSLEELENGFEGGPRIELPVVDVVGDDRELLETLIGQPPEAPEEAAETAPPPGEAQSSHTPSPAAATKPAARNNRAEEAAADAKRRAAERDAEAAERAALAEKARDGLRCHIDEIGAVVAPEAELGDTDILGAFIVRKLKGDVPEGMDRALSERLQGRRIDIAVRVDFFSELLLDAVPLDKAQFEAKAESLEIDGLEFSALTVHAPRLSVGTLLVRNKAKVFVSRELGGPLPESMIVELAGMGA